MSQNGTTRGGVAGGCCGKPSRGVQKSRLELLNPPWVKGYSRPEERGKGPRRLLGGERRARTVLLQGPWAASQKSRNKTWKLRVPIRATPVRQTHSQRTRRWTFDLRTCNHEAPTYRNLQGNNERGRHRTWRPHLHEPSRCVAGTQCRVYTMIKLWQHRTAHRYWRFAHQYWCFSEYFSNERLPS